MMQFVRVLKIHIRCYDVICWNIDVTVIYAAYAKCQKIQMASSREMFADLGEAKIKEKESVNTKKNYESKESEFLRVSTKKKLKHRENSAVLASVSADNTIKPLPK